MDDGTGRLPRRRHSAQCKADAIAACRKPGVSIAAAALERSMNANLLRRWVIEAKRGETSSLVASKPTLATGEGFVALPLPLQPADSTPIQIEVRRSDMILSVQWPRSAMHEYAIWLREVLK